MYLTAFADPYIIGCQLLPPGHLATQTTTDWFPVSLRTRYCFRESGQQLTCNVGLRVSHSHRLHFLHRLRSPRPGPALLYVNCKYTPHECNKGASQRRSRVLEQAGSTFYLRVSKIFTFFLSKVTLVEGRGMFPIILHSSKSEITSVGWGFQVLCFPNVKSLQCRGGVVVQLFGWRGLLCPGWQNNDDDDHNDNDDTMTRINRPSARLASNQCRQGCSHDIAYLRFFLFFFCEISSEKFRINTKGQSSSQRRHRYSGKAFRHCHSVLLASVATFLSMCEKTFVLTSVVLHEVHSHVCWNEGRIFFLLVHFLLYQFDLGFLCLFYVLDFCPATDQFLLLLEVVQDWPKKNS